MVLLINFFRREESHLYVFFILIFNLFICFLIIRCYIQVYKSLYCDFIVFLSTERGSYIKKPACLFFFSKRILGGVRPLKNIYIYKSLAKTCGSVFFKLECTGGSRPSSCAGVFLCAFFFFCFFFFVLQLPSFSDGLVLNSFLIFFLLNLSYSCDVFNAILSNFYFDFNNFFIRRHFYVQPYFF